MLMKRDHQEIDEGGGYIGYRQARQIIENHIQPLEEETAVLNQCAGRILAADLAAMQAWLTSLSLPNRTSIVADSEKTTSEELEKQWPYADAILTSGGAWGSQRDLIVGAMNRLGWHKLFHYVRMGPGKGVAFGLWRNRPFFCLPGGPSSNHMAFLQLALPALSRMGGDTERPLPTVMAKLIEDVNGRHRAWTEFKDAVVAIDGEGHYTVGLYRTSSRLQAIARANALIYSGR